jgi:hypothetical protein
MRPTVRAVSGVLAIAAVVACEPTAPRLVPVTLHLTDAPGVPAFSSSPDGEPLTVTGATVRISRTYLTSGESEEGPGLTITSEVQEFDLLALNGAAAALLGNALIPEGRYSQLRLVVESADVTLSDGITHTLFVASGEASGIKVTFPGTITVGGSATDITVDFDATANFRIAPPGGSNRVIFTPLLVGTVTEG